MEEFLNRAKRHDEQLLITPSPVQTVKEIPPHMCSKKNTERPEQQACVSPDKPAPVRASVGGEGNNSYALHRKDEAGGESGTVRSAIAQEIQFVLGGRLPFVKRSELLVWSWVLLSAYFVVKYGLLEAGLARTVAAFCIMYVVLDFYSGVLHVVLDDEWNMGVPLLSQPAMEFQYHHHIPDDGCSRPFIEGM